MEILKPNILKPALRRIGLNKPSLFAAGKPHGGKVKPYIAGHVTDGSSTFTFTVNGNESVTVPVDANGNWTWVVDRTITSLKNAFKDKTQLDDIELKHCVLDNCKSYYAVVRNTGIIRFKLTDAQTKIANDMTYALWGIPTLENLDLSDCTFANVTTAGAMCYNLPKITKLDMHSASFAKCENLSFLLADSAYEEVDMSNATIRSSCNVSYFARSANKLKTIILKAKGLFTSLSFPNSKLLTEQSIVNLFDAVAADGITLTFHATVFAMIEEQLEIEGSPIYEAYWNSDYDFNYASA